MLLLFQDYLRVAPIQRNTVVFVVGRNAHGVAPMQMNCLQQLTGVMAT